MKDLLKVVFVLGLLPILTLTYIFVRIILSKIKDRKRFFLVFCTLFICIGLLVCLVFFVDNISRTQSKSIGSSIKTLRQIYEAVALYNKDTGKMPPDLETLGNKYYPFDGLALETFTYVPNNNFGKHVPICWNKKAHLINHEILKWRSEPVWCVLFGDGKIRIFDKIEIIESFNTYNISSFLQ
jgi:hypothetical protein